MSCQSLYCEPRLFYLSALVAHCGANSEGPFLHTLVLTDVATGWTECLALLRRTLSKSTVFADDEEAWENERMELLRERYLELNGAEPAPRGRAWCTWRD